NTTRKNLPFAGDCVSFSHTASADAICEMTCGERVPPMVPRMPDTPIINASNDIHASCAEYAASAPRPRASAAAAAGAYGPVIIGLPGLAARAMLWRACQRRGRIPSAVRSAADAAHAFACEKL